MLLFDGDTDPDSIMHQLRTPARPSDEPDRRCRPGPEVSGIISWIVEAQSFSSKSNRFECSSTLADSPLVPGLSYFLGRELLATLLALA